MSIPEQIETARLLLRRVRIEDAPAMLEAYAGDPEATRFMSFPTSRSLADVEAFIDRTQAEWKEFGAGGLVIVEPRENRVIGGTGIHPENDALAETGYIFGKRWWGRGYASEVLGALVEAARQSQLRTLSACVHPDNARSIRVLEKNGFRCVGSCSDGSLPNLSPYPVRVLEYERRFRE